jgi:tetratricopeptide (TPR) repeat protein
MKRMASLLILMKRMRIEQHKQESMNFTMRLTAVAVVLCISMLSVAQNSNVTNAKFAYDAAFLKSQTGDYEGAAKDLKEAIAEIEPTISHEKTMAKEKTWRYRGMIYELVSRNLDQPVIAALDVDPVGKAANSYAKALELDSKGAYLAENTGGLDVMRSIALNTGVQRYNADDFAGAFDMFSKAATLSESKGVTDTLALYNAALSADRSGNGVKAIEYYKKTLKAGMPEPAIFQFMSNIHKVAGDTLAADNAIFDGRKAFPDNQALLIDEVNIYLGRGELEKAVTNLEKSVQADPTNATLQYSVGSVYDNLGKIEKARENYAKAIVLDNNYFDPNYNMGASYYNEAVELINKANAIPPNKIKEYEAAKKKADDVFKQALPFLERAHEISPDDVATIKSLGEIYARTGDLEKRKAIMAKLQQ